MLRTLLLAFALTSSTAAAQDVAATEPMPAPSPSRWRPENYVGVDIVGFLGFLRLSIGSFQLYYEHVFDQHHGVMIAGDFVHVHQDAEHEVVHLWTFGGSLTYRYYFGPGVGPFAGLALGYRRGFGHEGRTTHVALDIEQFRALVHLGYRFYVPAVQLAVVPRVGFGYGEYRVSTGRNDDVGRASAAFARDVLAPWGFVFEAELSFAVGF
jgi:hypothetical protein